MKVSVIGAGSMGSGIAQIASTAGCEVTLYDNNPDSLEIAGKKLVKIMNRLVEKEKITQEVADGILGRIDMTSSLPMIEGSSLVVEAIIENLDIKKQVFTKIENLVDSNCILASNTSSLSIASIASACKNRDLVIGLHFFNPAPLMPLVEIIPAITTSNECVVKAKELMLEWGKAPVVAKDTPGFIVNRVARSFYSEGLRIYEEGIADMATIDWAMKEIGGFRMGPFELMDFIGHDVNYAVTESVFKEFYFDPRFKPSITQKRLVEAGLLGRKSGKGFYDYTEGTEKIAPNENRELGELIFNRIIVMLINEAADSLHLNIASKEDLDTAMTRGVNYPKGLLQWGDEIGVTEVYNRLNELFVAYGEDRYRPSFLLRKMSKSNENFYN